MQVAANAGHHGGAAAARPERCDSEQVYGWLLSQGEALLALPAFPAREGMSPRAVAQRSQDLKQVATLACLYRWADWGVVSARAAFSTHTNTCNSVA